mmetsp:Transcript_116571/g.329697  ORF Transcript_116571/g.329697 Transcript_116571/m.329697 type:complete len:260 (-) Transcript_116571:13-792(-)
MHENSKLGVTLVFVRISCPHREMWSLGRHVVAVRAGTWCWLNPLDQVLRPLRRRAEAPLRRCLRDRTVSPDVIGTRTGWAPSLQRRPAWRHNVFGSCAADETWKVVRTRAGRNLVVHPDLGAPRRARWLRALGAQDLLVRVVARPRHAWLAGLPARSGAEAELRRAPVLGEVIGVRLVVAARTWGVHLNLPGAAPERKLWGCLRLRKAGRHRILQGDARLVHAAGCAIARVRAYCAFVSRAATSLGSVGISRRRHSSSA